MRQTCQRCHSEFCFACEEPISATKVKRPTAATDDDPLFHCSNLQGVILGIGLSMLEQLFSEQTQDQIQELLESKDNKTRSSKRRKTDSTLDLDDDDTVYYASVQGGKKRGGTGYAGEQKEDVSSDVVYVYTLCLLHLDFWTNRSPGSPARQG